MPFSSVLAHLEDRVSDLDHLLHAQIESQSQRPVAGQGQGQGQVQPTLAKPGHVHVPAGDNDSGGQSQVHALGTLVRSLTDELSAKQLVLEVEVGAVRDSMAGSEERQQYQQQQHVQEMQHMQQQLQQQMQQMQQIQQQLAVHATAATSASLSKKQTGVQQTEQETAQQQQQQHREQEDAVHQLSTRLHLLEKHCRMSGSGSIKTGTDNLVIFMSQYSSSHGPCTLVL